MSKIEKLSILGVRSFGHQKAETIAFHAPLTLIVGYNGSGKTTIIECLKYATTGELPPNSKTGGAFIHDPKLAGEKEVLAMVKVSFRSTSGVRMVVARRLQLTVKKTTRSQKTLDGSLVIRRDGENHSVSTRVAELDQLIPQYLGVSKAVLEYVIFCHQDDSLWPMSEPSVLKKRFDEIFEALKYTKAIDNIKILRKKQAEELAKLKIIAQHAKEDREKGERSEQRQQKLYDEMEDYRARVTDIDAKIIEAEEKAKDAFDHASRFEQIVAQLNGKRITLQANRESVADLEDNLQHMAESDEELQSMLDKYEERVSLYGKQQEEFRKQYTELRHELDANRRSLGAKQADIGKFEAEKDQYERQLRKRDNLVKEAAKRHGIRGYDYDITDKQVADFLGIIGKMSRDQDKQVQRARQETQEELKKAQGVLNKLNDRKAALTQSKEMSRSQIATNEGRISGLQHNMGQIRVDEGSAATLEGKKTDTARRLQAANSEATKERYDERIQQADAAVRTLDERKEKLEAEMVDATKLARETAQIEYAQDELKNAKHGLRTMEKVHGSRIAKFIDADWEPASLDEAYQRVLSQKSAKVKEAESRRDIAQTNLANVNFKLNNVESQLEKNTTQLKEYTEIVTNATGKADITDFDENLKELEEEYEGASTDKAKFEAAIDYMEACLRVAEEKDQCRLCKRHLVDTAKPYFTKADFIQDLKKLINNNKKKMSNDAGASVDELLAELEAVRSAQPSYELAIRLQDKEIPALRREHVKLTSERDVINKQLEEHDSIIDDLRTSKQDVELLSKDVQSLVNYHNQVRDLETKIRNLAENQKAAGSSRGIDAVQDDLKKVGEEGRNAKASLNRLTAEREKLRNTTNTLELRVRDINAELNHAQSKLKEKRDLAERIAEYKQQTNEQREAIRSIDKDVETLLPQIEQAQFKYDDINRRGNEQVQRLQTEASNLSDSVRQLSDVEQDINAYIDKGGPKQLARAHKEIEALQGELARIEEEMVQVTRKLKKIEDGVRDTENMKRSIADNLRYRKAKRALESLAVEIQELESHNAEADKERYDRDGRKWQNDWTRLSTERATLHGTLRTMDDQLKELMAEWETEYKDAAYTYREAHIKVETTKAAVEDLGRYGGALDKAIMKYHTLKMEEINQIVGELWKGAYQGTDVDTIRIRSDNETGKGNRSYNYRVVMVKQDAEMDMRGRCSAGQKVLASIVIRLALAECFGQNCGIIALDEPTTNLDYQNIAGLATSLSEIIKIRREQANFQLIVITHDEQFLRAMNCQDFADIYWRVCRNAQQTSVIEQQHISVVV